tara:strand:+ start:219 stop:506 length:288 start_codon:yes stop_codon:yes gene_type:complete
MTILERIAEEIEAKIEKASSGKIMRPSVLFCGCNSQLKKDMHKRAKRVGLNPAYSIKHPTIKVELQNNRKIETDEYKTISMDYENFEFICRYLES